MQKPFSIAVGDKIVVTTANWEPSVMLGAIYPVLAIEILPTGKEYVRIQGRGEFTWQLCPHEYQIYPFSIDMPADTSTTTTTTTVYASGAKRDNKGKLQYSLLPLELLDGTVRVLMKGAEKHGRNNYKAGLEPLDTIDSLLRHLTDLKQAIETGDTSLLSDKETGECHAHHIICNALFLVNDMRKQGFNI